MPFTETASEQVGRYRLCFELASGGMATVYLARVDGTAGFQKLVALKRIHPHLSKQRGYVEMFLDEARIALRITHANVCSVIDFGEANGEYFIAMEYLVGEPLTRLFHHVSIRSADTDGGQAQDLKMARIVADASEGLHAAHELKDANGALLHVVHRDVSPKNLFITYEGVVQVVDFGIASARQRLYQTSTGEVKGTLSYIAPEAMLGETVDRRSDVWSLGVVLWELLALKRLFRREGEASTMYAVLKQEIPTPSTHRPGVCKELEAIVMKALERDPEKRWQTAREMSQALREVLSGQTVGPPELSEWLGNVFPDGRRRKHELMEVALKHREKEVTLSAVRPGHAKAGVEPAPRGMSRGSLGLAFLSALGVAATAYFVTRPVPDAALPPPPSRFAATRPPREATPPVIAVPPPAPLATPAWDPKAEEDLKPLPEATSAPKKAQAKKPRRARRSTPRQERAVGEGQGKVRILTRGGWANVYQGDKSLGKTPATIELPAGRHKLTLRPFGDGHPLPISVTVVPNATKSITFSFD